MTPDDYVYALLLITSLPLAHCVKFLKCPLHKQVFVASVGIVFVVVTCGYSGLHSLVTVLVNIAIVKLVNPKYCHLFSFVWCFGYLTFFRLCHLLGLPSTGSCINANQLLMTLKMVGLAFEIHDNCKQQEPTQDGKDSLSGKTKEHDSRTPVTPSAQEMLAYSYSFIGLLTGPYYKFKTFQDMIHTDFGSHIATKDFIIERNKHLPIIIITFFILSNYFKLEHVTSDWFYSDTNVVHRLSYMVVMFAIFRSRLYIAWLLSEAVCMLARLGAYPVESLPKCGQGPTNRAAFEEWKSKTEEEKRQTTFNFETIKSVDIWGCELAPTVREGMKSWNMTVQYWLAANVYKRIRASSIVRVAITMMVSAYWHGVHPGYYLSFIIIPFNLAAEDLMGKVFKNSKWSVDVRAAKAFEHLCWFFKMRTFDYMCMGFLLLSFSNTMTYWRSIYFCGHLFVVFFIAVGMFINNLSVKKNNQKKLE